MVRLSGSVISTVIDRRSWIAAMGKTGGHP